MKISVNGKPFTPVEAPTTFGRLFELITLELEYCNCTVAKILLDGQEIELPEYEDEFPPKGFLGQEVEIELQNIGELLRTSLDDGARLLSMILEEISSCVEEFHAGRQVEAHQMYAPITQKIQVFIKYIDEVIRFISQLTGDKSFGVHVDQLNNQTLELTKEMLIAQEKQDYVRLVDLLEFEMVSLLDKWNTFLSGIKISSAS